MLLFKCYHGIVGVGQVGVVLSRCSELSPGVLLEVCTALSTAPYTSLHDSVHLGECMYVLG